MPTASHTRFSWGLVQVSGPAARTGHEQVKAVEAAPPASCSLLSRYLGVLPAQAMHSVAYITLRTVEERAEC